MAALTGTGTKLRLYFRAEKLRDMDTFSKSDPYVVVYHRFQGQTGSPVGTTEHKKNDLDPVFEKAIDVEYLFESKQEFVAVVYDDDGKGPQGDDVLGTAPFQLAHVVGSRGGTLKINLNPGALYITAKEQSNSGRDTVKFQFVGKDLKKMDFFGSSDPYFKFERILPNGTTKLLYQSRVVDNNLNPDWEETPSLRIAELTTADLSERTLRFHCYDKDVFSDDSMGFFDTSFQELLEAHQTQKPIPLKKPHKPQNRYGDIFVKGMHIVHFPTFVQFLNAGMQVNLSVAIDFTGSNGDPRKESSLHYMDPVKPNQYVRATMSVGDILMEYDTDKMVPVTGFGAKLPDGQVSHCFNLTFTPDPQVHGVQGILDAYGRALSSVQLAGPTNFAPTIRNALQAAMNSQGTYSILLILTDGEITDMDRTIDAIVDCDAAPLSIIIVGVGNGSDFAMMDTLDGDEARLRSSRGVQMKRDIVQFVPFRKFVNAPPSALAAEVLREVPDQVVDWAIATGRGPTL